MIIATICCALSFNFSFIGLNIIIMFSLFRFILGIGIGGDYPLSAIIASEFANVEKRGLIMSAVFSMQGLGILVAPIVALIILAFYKPLIEENYENIDYVWRFCIVFGIIPAFIALYFRLKIPESPRYTAHVMGNMEKAQEDMGKIFDNTRPMLENFQNDEVARELNKEKINNLSFKSFFSKWKNLKILLGCSISWFALDVAFYGSNLNQSIVLNEIGFAPVDLDIYTNIHRLILSNLVIVFFGTCMLFLFLLLYKKIRFINFEKVPGYWLTVFTIEKIGRKKIQFIGFAVTGVCWLLLGLFHNYLVENSVVIFIILYIIGQFFFNFGPNTTTFIIPGEIFPTRFKSTCHGIAAASGKAGAILSAQGFSLLKETWGVANLLLVFSFFMFCGFLATFWVPETMGKTLEELEEPKSPEYQIELKDLEEKKN